MPKVKFKLKTTHFLTGEELSFVELHKIIDLAIELKSLKNHQTLKNKTIALLFEKPSLRTRVSFAVAITQLSGNFIELNSSNGKKENAADSIRVLQGYVDGFMLRTFSHKTLTTMTEYSRIPIINGLSDTHHPCQALADLQTLKERFGKLQGLTVSYIGDGNNMLHSMLILLPFVGVHVNYSCPQKYQPNEQILKTAQERAKNSAARIQSFKNPKDAVLGAHAIYTDVWTSMGFEAESEARTEAFSGYQINSNLLALAESNAVVMHCMPVHEGQEITREIIEHPRSLLFQQSENRLHAQKALLMGLFGEQNV